MKIHEKQLRKENMGIPKGYRIYTNLSTRQLDLSTGQLDN